MKQISKSALLPYSASEMFALVTDIASYPEFLPWCGAARIITQEGEQLTASIDIAYKGVNKSFTTRNLMQRNKLLEMRLVDGPFKHLQGYWCFQALDEVSSKVNLDLEFEFSNPLVGMLIGPVFEHIANTLVESFHQRAVELYGPRS